MLLVQADRIYILYKSKTDCVRFILFGIDSLDFFDEIFLPFIKKSNIVIGKNQIKTI